MDNYNFKVVKSELRPWGGFHCIDDQEIENFVAKFFPHLTINKDEKLSPKILFVNPRERLSWQYHNRREEIWSVIEGPIGVIRSFNDNQNPIQIHYKGDIIKLEKQERHRLVGLEKLGVVAEIWKHTDINNPSNEEDIIRLQDDYLR